MAKWAISELEGLWFKSCLCHDPNNAPPPPAFPHPRNIVINGEGNATNLPRWKLRARELSAWDLIRLESCSYTLLGVSSIEFSGICFQLNTQKDQAEVCLFLAALCASKASLHASFFACLEFRVGETDLCKVGKDIIMCNWQMKTG